MLNLNNNIGMLRNGVVFTEFVYCHSNDVMS